MQLPTELTQLGAPAWVVALATAGFLGAKALVLVRGTPPKDASESSEWRGRMISLAERQEMLIDRIAGQQSVMLGMMDKMHSTLIETRKLVQAHDEWERARGER